jgi:hypothetical protein
VRFHAQQGGRSEDDAACVQPGRIEPVRARDQDLQPIGYEIDPLQLAWQWPAARIGKEIQR